MSEQLEVAHITSAGEDAVEDMFVSIAAESAVSTAEKLEEMARQAFVTSPHADDIFGKAKTAGGSNSVDVSTALAEGKTRGLGPVSLGGLKLEHDSAAYLSSLETRLAKVMEKNAKTYNRDVILGKSQRMYLPILLFNFIVRCLCMN